MGKKYIYGTKESLNSVQDYLNDVNRVLSDKSINASSVDKLSWSSDAMKKVTAGVIAGAGTGAAVLAGSGAAAGAGAGALGAGGLVGASHFVGGAAATGGAAAGSVVVPALIVALPVAAIAGLILGVFLAHSKNKEEKERLFNELHLYKDAIKKQNNLTREISDIKEKLEKKNEEYKKLYERYQLLSEINRKLMEYIRNLEGDLRTGKVITA